MGFPYLFTEASNSENSEQSEEFRFKQLSFNQLGVSAEQLLKTPCIACIECSSSGSSVMSLLVILIVLAVIALVAYMKMKQTQDYADGPSQGGTLAVREKGEDGVTREEDTLTGQHKMTESEVLKPRKKKSHKSGKKRSSKKSSKGSLSSPDAAGPGAVASKPDSSINELPPPPPDFVKDEVKSARDADKTAELDQSIGGVSESAADPAGGAPTDEKSGKKKHKKRSHKKHKKNKEPKSEVSEGRNPADDVAPNADDANAIPPSEGNTETGGVPEEQPSAPIENPENDQSTGGGTGETPRKKSKKSKKSKKKKNRDKSLSQPTDPAAE